MTRLLQEQLTELADSADAHGAPHTDLLAGALALATRHRRRRAAGVGIVTLGVAAVTAAPLVVPFPWAAGPAGVAAQPTPAVVHTLDKPPVSDPLPSKVPTPKPAQLPVVLGTVERASALVFHGTTVDAVDAATGRREPVLRLGSASAASSLGVPNSGSLSPDGTKLAVPSTELAGDEPGTVSGIWVLDLTTGEGKLYDTDREAVMSVLWSPGGDRMWAYRYGGPTAWILDTGTGAFERLPGVDQVQYWDGPDRLVTQGSTWRVVDDTGHVVRELPKLAPYTVLAGTWMPGEWAGWSPGGTWLGMTRRDLDRQTFAAVDVATGQVARTWGPFVDELNTQNIVGWSGPDTMVVMLRNAGSDHGIQLWDLDVATGTKHLRATYADADSVKYPANGMP